MKRKQLLGFAVAGLLVLSGCQSKVQDDGKDVIASIQGKNITADDVYKNLSTVAGSQGASFTFVLDQLVNEKFPVTSDMKENANEMIENIETTYDNQYGDEADTQLESALASAGYKNMDDYKHHDHFYSCLEQLSIDDVKKAIERSKRIMEINQRNGYQLQSYKGYSFYRENPSLMVWEIVEKILKDCHLI